ncbi:MULTISPECIES: TIGR03086 family metal-binding protein [Actinomycetes]|uniref:Maleylpyruvate isomerase family mycothiol-dependent enzyme n=2 Tax=Actinomycetes TaxID=1760 RepID=A0ABP6LU51_9MICC
MSLPAASAARHRRVAEDFTRVSAAVTDWDAPTPVPEWRARDVPRHLVEWSSEFLRSVDVILTAGPSPLHDPHGAWRHHREQIQSLVDAEDADRDVTHPQLGTLPLQDMVDRFYTADVFMHTWDLAVATGQDPALDEEHAEALLQGMRPMEEAMRASGQFGPPVPVEDDAPASAQLMGFIGRDPHWRP